MGVYREERALIRDFGNAVGGQGEDGREEISMVDIEGKMRNADTSPHARVVRAIQCCS